MSIVNYGNDFEYANSRLSGTVVRIKEKPVYVSHVLEDSGVAEGYFTLTNEPFECDLCELFLPPVPLGYVNTKEGCTFGQRIPTRHYKQGLNGSNFYGREFRPGYKNVDTARTILGLYPSPMEVAEYVLNGEVSSKAFSRNFALAAGSKSSLNLMFRSQQVGKVTWNDEIKNLNYHLSDKAMYLQEMLEESISV